MRSDLGLMLFDVSRFAPIMVERYMPAFMGENVELLAGASFRRMDDAVLREGPTMKTVADDPVMDHSGFGLDGFCDREEACGCLLAGGL